MTLNTALLQRQATDALWQDLKAGPAVMTRLKGIPVEIRSGKGGIALFSGASGTGKTLAAQIIAAELGMDLYRVDLAAVINKYIGDTEKNLNELFAQAEENNVVLLFDEADALFGKRTEVKDAHDRYANLESGYLLDRIEQYPGLVILTSNLRNDIDDAFLQRVQWTIDFRPPRPKRHLSIWRRLLRWLGL